MKRLAFRVKLKPGKEEEFGKRHDELWPELQHIIYETDVKDYAIFIDAETNILLVVQNIRDDRETVAGTGSCSQGFESIESNPIQQKWWEALSDILDPLSSGEAPTTFPDEEIFQFSQKK